MSAMLLWCALVLGTHASASCIGRNDKIWVNSTQNNTLSIDNNGFEVHSQNRKIVVEEVDRNGNSIIKELELPDYYETEELQEERKRRREQQEKKYQRKTLKKLREQDMYGCETRRGNQRRKCLRRQKKLLRKRYKNWKELIHRIMKDLDGKIKTSGSNRKRKREVTTENLNFMSGFSPRNAMRKKE